MAPRLVIRHDDSSYTLYLDEGQGCPLALAENVPYQHPLGDDDLNDIRWYIEEYPDAPFGAYRGRASGVIKRLGAIGESITRLIRSSDETAAKLRSVLADEELQIWVESTSPAVLSVPWELLALEGAGPRPRLANVVRTSFPSVEDARDDSLSAQASVEKTSTRILFIISRPLGVHDVSFGIVSKPILRAFENFGDAFEVHVLRPPTFASLQSSLTEARRSGRPYTVIHFDGHGALHLSAGQGGPTATASGYIFFEKEGATGGFEPVSAEQLASVLRDAGAQVVIFNACESARFTSQVPPEAVIASRLLREGIPAVVGMAYSVRAQTASAFMRALYMSLLRGVGIINAAHEARLELASRISDTDPASDIDHDWFVPVIYARQNARLVTPLGRGLAASPRDLQEPVLGRDREFYELERHFRSEQSLLLFGVIGAGKTALLGDFLSWLRTSRGIPAGGEVWRYDLRHEDPQAVLQTLRTRIQTGGVPAVLVLENMDQVGHLGASAKETAAMMLTLLSSPGLKWILTSRGPEFWLGEIGRIYIGGLPERMSVELLSRSSDRAGLPEHTLRAFIESSFGNPGYLTRTAHLLAEMPDGPDCALWGRARPDRERAATILRLFPEVEEALCTLPPVVRSFAYLLSLFNRIVDPLSLAFMSLGSDFAAAEEVHDEEGGEMFLPPPQRFRGLGPELWQTLLQGLEDLGLASVADGGVWELHPVTGIALGAAWEEEAGAAFEEELAEAKKCLMKVLVTHSSASLMAATAAAERGAGPATDYRLLENALRFAVDESFFTDAFFIYRSAAGLRSAAGGGEAVHELAEMVRGWLRERHGRRPLPTEPGRLLWTLTFENMNLFPSKQQSDASLREAESVLQEVEEGLPVEPSVLGFAYHSLGAAAGNAGRLDESESWYRKAIEVAENDYSKFMSYNNLVVLAMQRGDYSQAESYISEARRIAEASEVALPVRNLRSMEGIIALKRGLTDKAVDLQDQVLADLNEQDGLSLKAAAMHEMGLAHMQEGNLKEAEAYFKQSIRYKQGLRSRASLFTTYSALGELKVRTGELEEAESWLQEAQAILNEGVETPQFNEGSPRPSFAVRRAELLQHQHKYEEMCSLLEPLVLGSAGADVSELDLYKAGVLLGYAYISTQRSAEAVGVLDVAVSGLRKISVDAPSGETLRYLGMALSLRAGTHGEDKARAIDDALSGCEQLLASVKLDRALRGSFDFYLGLSLAFAAGRIDTHDEAARARAVATGLAWFDHLGDSGGGLGVSDGSNDFFAQCVVSLSQLLIRCQDYQPLAEVLKRGLATLRDPREWPNRSRALAEILYSISRKVETPPAEFILALDPRRWGVLADSYPSPDDISAMVFEFYTWVASHLCREGHVRFIEGLRDDLAGRERELGDVSAGEGLAKLYIYLIFAYCLAGRVEDAVTSLETLRARADTSEVSGADLLSYAYSVKNVIVSLGQEGRIGQAAQIASRCIEMATRFGHLDFVSDLLLGGAVDMVGVYASRRMFPDADGVVSQLESLRRRDTKIVNLNFTIANTLLQLFYSAAETGSIPLALGYAKKLSDIASSEAGDRRIVGANVIVSSNLVVMYAGTGHLNGALALMPQMFEACLGGAFEQDRQTARQMTNLLTETVGRLKEQLGRDGNQAGLSKLNDLLRKLSSQYHFDGL